MKLHLGCGRIHLPGFVNIDSQYFPGIDDVCDIRYLPKRRYPPESSELIYASHVLEHFNRWEYKEVLRRWFEILQPQGILRLAVPNFAMLAKWYLEHGDLDEIIGPLHGSQDGPGNFHYYCWDFATLSRELKSVGFRQVRYWDWRTTEHADIDDNSQAYFPYMDKVNGVLESLNLEGIK